MAWEELIRLHEKQTEQTDAGTDDSAREKGTLIQQARSFAEQSGGAEPEEENAAWEEEDTPRCADGYMRRSAVQHYCTAEDYNRRRLYKAAEIAAVLCVAALLVLVMVRSGLLRF
ncbi:MAG: hypothetical protein IJU66_04625 [Oscillospiraceae bacterium]|nr:hypothetical protein [Oscillospiraceae bacterium]